MVKKHKKGEVAEDRPVELISMESKAGTDEDEVVVLTDQEEERLRKAQVRRTPLSEDGCADRLRGHAGELCEEPDVVQASHDADAPRVTDSVGAVDRDPHGRQQSLPGERLLTDVMRHLTDIRIC